MDEYKIKLGKEIKPKDIILHDLSWKNVLSADQGRGAGNIEFGEYIIVQSVNIISPYKREDFWIFNEQPIIVRNK